MRRRHGMLGKKHASIEARAIDHFLALHLLGLFPLAAPGSFSPQGSLSLGSWQPRLCAPFLCPDWVVAEYFARKLNNARLLSFDGKRVTRTDYVVHVRHSLALATEYLRGALYRATRNRCIRLVSRVLDACFASLKQVSPSVTQA